MNLRAPLCPHCNRYDHVRRLPSGPWECDDCGRVFYTKSYTPASGSLASLQLRVKKGQCPYCHEPLVGHIICTHCEIRLGPRHAYGLPVKVNGQPYCAQCVARLQKEQA